MWEEERKTFSKVLNHSEVHFQRIYVSMNENILKERKWKSAELLRNLKQVINQRKQLFMAKFWSKVSRFEFHKSRWHMHLQGHTGREGRSWENTSFDIWRGIIFPSLPCFQYLFFTSEKIWVQGINYNGHKNWEWSKSILNNQNYKFFKNYKPSG